MGERVDDDQVDQLLFSVAPDLLREMDRNEQLKRLNNTADDLSFLFHEIKSIIKGFPLMSKPSLEDVRERVSERLSEIHNALNVELD